MAFKVCCFPKTPDFETLHAAKLTEFPLEKRDYKPFSQARICFSKEGLHVRFHCFEAESMPKSSIRAILEFSPGKSLQLLLYADGEYQIENCDGNFQPFSGEDLQGVYWGGTFTVSKQILLDSFGFIIKPGISFLGNFYKICESPEKQHYGSFYPADFSQALDIHQNLGGFLLVEY